MGPPLNSWHFSQGPTAQGLTQDLANHGLTDQESDIVKSDFRRSVLAKVMDSFRVMCINFTFALVIFQILAFSLQPARAGPVIFNMEYSQGPVPLARNIRHLPCISRRTSQEGLCMFAIDCLKANGTHLGTCIDRFYFGSCCQIPDKTILPQIIGNHIDDNSIDGANFVHPQIEEHKPIKPVKDSIFPFKITTEKATETTIAIETKSDEQTTIDNKINDDITEATTLMQESKATEIPIKLSTFQTVSGEMNTVTDKLETNAPTFTVAIPTSSVPTSTATLRPKPTRKPTRPSSFTRPTYKPYNITRPQYTQSTFKPKPIKPALNTTRKPPYRLPPKRPSTKKPLPLPPRLNITILPQSTSSKPLFTRPQSVSITYINATQSSTKEESKPTTTLSTTTVTTTTPSTTTEKVTQETQKATTENIETTEAISFFTTELEKVVTDYTTETIEYKTTEETTEKETVRPVTEADIPVATDAVTTSSEYPPFATWSSNSDSVTNAPEKVTEPPTTTTEETWSPITPPEGWILLSTIAPKPETTVSTTTTEAPTTEVEAQGTTISLETETPTEASEATTEAVTTSTSTTTTTIITTSPTTTTTTTTSTTPITTSSTTTTPAPTTTEIPISSSSTPVSTSSTTESPKVTEPLQEFTVNVTLSPTVPTSTSSSGLTFTLLSESNDTKGNETVSSTESTGNVTVETSTNASTIETTTERVNMSDFKNVCGRRLWQAPTGRIVGGAKSDFGMWPWQISLRQYRTSTYLHKCGAALLNENWAITAAHCVEHVPPSELLVRLGEHDLASEDEPYGFAERRVQIVASHPHFDPATFEYDIALLRFYEPVTFQPNILPVCVPDDDDDYVGKTAYVTGWGRLYDEGPLPSVLQEVQVPVINNSACEAMYQAAGYNEHIPNIFICAGRSKGGTDSCEGDSGGPMVLPRTRDGRFVLGGVISWGIGCAEPNQPGVYTRISEFRDWINQILQF